MPSGISKTIKHRFPKRRNSIANKPQPTTPVSVVSATKGTTIVTVVFNQPVGLKGVPAYTTNLAGISALSAAQINPTTIAVTFSASIATGTTLNIPYEEPAVRNSSGGFVKDSTFQLS